MNVTTTVLPEVLMLDPAVYRDARGLFTESWNRRTFHDATGSAVDFVQDNHSRSVRHVLRGIHYQVERPQGKLVRVTAGAVFDVAVDLRRSSPNFGRWAGVELTGESFRQLWIPPGFGHAFLVLSDTADFLYKTTDYRHAEHERCIRWDDESIGIDWPLGGQSPLLAPKDAVAPRLAQAQTYS